MLNSLIRKLNKVDEGDPGGETPPDETKPPAAADEPGAEAGGDNLDEFGYEKPAKAEGEKPPADDKKKATEQKAPEKVEKPVTGYGDEPPAVDAPTVPKPPEKPEEPHELDPHVKELPKEEALKVKEFAKTNALSVDQVKAYAELRKGELVEVATLQARLEEDSKIALQQRRAEWHKELKSDPDFGGENYDKNRTMVERLIEDFMPSTKKVLTEKGGMLPPNFMRDLAKLGEKVYGTEKLVHGDPKVEVKVDDKKNDPLDFYKD